MSVLGKRTPWWASWPFFVTVTLCLWYVLLDESLLARAGGFGGGGGGGAGGGSRNPIVILIKLAILVINLVHWALFVLFRSEAVYYANKHWDEASDGDRAWSRRPLEARIRNAFFAIQNAWMARDQSSAKGFMSARLYADYSKRSREMVQKHEKNVLKDIRLSSAKVVEVLDFEDDRRDALSVLVQGEMIDYTVDDRTGKTLRGSESKTERFVDLWRFKREGSRWVVDAIDGDVGVLALAGVENRKSKKLPTKKPAQKRSAK